MEHNFIWETDRAGRVRATHERQQQLVNEWKLSGQSAMRFAESVGLKSQTLTRWIRRHSASRDHAMPMSVPNWLKVDVAPHLPDANTSLRIELSGAATVLLHDAGQLPLLIQLLRALP